MAAERTRVNAQVAPNSAELADRRERVYAMRLTGKSLGFIAQAEGVSKTTVFNDIEAVIKAKTEVPAQQVREMELDRLDLLLDKLMPRVEQGDVQAIQTALKVMDRRAKFLGLDAPTKQDVTVHQADPMDTALGELMREARARQALEEQALREGSE